MERLFHDFYVQPMQQVYVETIALYLLWMFFMVLLKGRARNHLARTTALLGLALILLYTVVGRGTADVRVISLTPFITFERAKAEVELYRTMYMNMLLFLPLGLSLPFALPQKWKCKALLSAVAGFLLSVGVEAIQYFFRIGDCETDDVLMNTLGMLIGISSFGIVCLPLVLSVCMLFFCLYFSKSFSKLFFYCVMVMKILAKTEIFTIGIAGLYFV